MKKREWLNLPNMLTAMRILLVAVFVIVYFTVPAELGWLPMLVFLVAGLTDCLDGYIARRYNLITTLGKILDPVADKLLSSAVVFCLGWSGVVPWPLFALVAAKELYMAWGTWRCLRKKITVQADIYGKIATITFYPATLLAWPWHGVDWMCDCGRFLIYVSVALSIVAVVHYTIIRVKKSREMDACGGAH